MKNLNRILFSLIAPVLDENAKCEMQNAESGAELDEKTLRAVYALAKKHDVGHLLACGVRNAELSAENFLSVGDGALDVPPNECKTQNAELSAEILAELERAELTAVWRVKNIENEQGRVRKCLEDAQIPFILLKGAVIRRLYPEAWMRTSSDIDVLVPRDMLSEAVKAITDGLGYRISTTEPHDASLFAPSGVHLDMHTLFEGDGEDCRLLEQAWENAKCEMQSAESGYERFLTGEDFYFYHVAHMAKHMRNGGCGIRPFIDLYLINAHIKCDRAKLDAMLKEHGLYRFEAAALALSGAWIKGGLNAKCKMQNAESDAAELGTFEEYVLTGGVYGSSEQYVAARQIGGRRGKFRYILRRIFMPYGELKERHPILKKHKWLTPVFEVWRWLGLLVPSRFKRGRKELSSTMRVDAERITGVEALFESLGL